MRPGISDDLQHVDDSRKTAIIARLNVSIAALQRTRHASSGSLREENYTFFWNGKEPDKPRLYGVGFAVRNSLMASVEPQTGGTERILSIGMATAAGVINIFSVYAPTLGTSDDIKDHFYDELDTQIARIPQTGPVLILGDFNARVGSDTQSWPGHDCWSCAHTMAFFQFKPKHRLSWKHPRSHRWHQLDLVITRRSAFNSILAR